MGKEDSTEANKPPLGLKPKYIHDGQRISEIEAAFERYIIEDKEIPSVWVKEYLSLIKLN